MAGGRSLPVYSTGTVTVASVSGTWTVTGSSTNFIAPDGVANYTLLAGDMFVCGGAFGTIASVAGATSFTLDFWTGGAVSSATAYKIYRYEGLATSAVSALINQLLTLGTDSNPESQVVVDTGAVRFKLDDDGSGDMRFRVRSSTASGGDSAYVTAFIINMTSGVATFPPGIAGGGSGAAGLVGFTTLALLNANLNYPANTIAQVVSDPTPSNDGLYLKSGASGAGSWSQVSTLTLSGLAAAVALCAPLASPAFTGNPTAPNQSALDNSTKISTTAYADAAVAVETTRAVAVAAVNHATLSAAVAERAADILDRTTPRLVYDATTGAAALDADNELHVYIVMGQSNALGAVDTSSPVAASPLFLEKAWMPATGVRVNGTPFNSLAPLVETTTMTSLGETMCSGFVNHLLSRLYTLFPTARLPNICAFVSAIGSQSYYQLKRGSPAYEAALQAVADVVTIAEASGLTVSVKGILWNQGESDVYTATRDAYAASMRQFQRDLAQDFARITGQRDRVVLFLIQTNRVLNSLIPFGEVQLAQVDADATPDIRIVGPMYPYPMSTYSTTDSHVHHNNTGQNRIGQMAARAVFAEIYGAGWRAVLPYHVYWYSTTVLVVACTAPTLPLVLDTSGDVSVSGMATEYGFVLHKPDLTSAATISTVAIVNFGVLMNNAVALTLSAPPASGDVFLSYAMIPDAYDGGGASEDGPVTGPRGCIHDSTVDVSLYDSHAGYNWMPAWTLKVQG